MSIKHSSIKFDDKKIAGTTKICKKNVVNRRKLLLNII